MHPAGHHPLDSSPQGLLAPMRAGSTPGYKGVTPGSDQEKVNSIVARSLSRLLSSQQGPLSSSSSTTQDNMAWEEMHPGLCRHWACKSLPAGQVGLGQEVTQNSGRAGPSLALSLSQHSCTLAFPSKSLSTRYLIPLPGR